MGKIKLLLFTALLGLGLTSVAIFLGGQSVAYAPKRIIDSLPTNVDMLLSGVKFTEITDSGHRWTLETSTMSFIKDKSLMVFDRFEAVFTTDEGPMLITGNKGFYDKETHKIRLTGNVEAQDAEGNRLSTEELHYDITSKILVTPGKFSLTGPSLDLAGSGLTVNTNDNSLKVTGRPTVVLKDGEQVI